MFQVTSWGNETDLIDLSLPAKVTAKKGNPQKRSNAIKTHDRVRIYIDGILEQHEVVRTNEFVIHLVYYSSHLILRSGDARLK